MIVNLTDKDNGSTVIAKKDDRVIITLTWNPSSGFFWQEGDTTAGTLEELKHDPGDEIPGSLNTVIFKFKIIAEGLLQLNYARPWAETAPPAKWFSVNIKET
jgi:predicted secreted protein